MKHERLQDETWTFTGKPSIIVLNPRITIQKTQILSFNMNVYRMKYERLGWNIFILSWNISILRRFWGTSSSDTKVATTFYRHITPLGFKRVGIAIFYRHAVPTELKRVATREKHMFCRADAVRNTHRMNQRWMRVWHSESELTVWGLPCGLHRVFRFPWHGINGIHALWHSNQRQNARVAFCGVWSPCGLPRPLSGGL